MNDRPPKGALGSWLEIVEGEAPVLLIAPHGGRAGAAAAATLHPKVNDLETAAITRELAARLAAAALINTGMDRNELDCNRLAQLAERAPWMLHLLADRIDRIIARHGRATVLLIHGWNVIEPRVDLGLGLRETAGRLHPPAGAHVSASDHFINGPIAELAARLRAASILPSFGLRYPGGAAQNLLQAFTPRHGRSTVEPVRRLAAIAERGLIDALQLEMSVAVRLPGDLRERNLDAIGEIFSRRSNRAVSAGISVPIVRAAASRPPKKTAAGSGQLPLRVGIEFYDPAAQVGGMASFDFGPGAAGARILVSFDRRRLALFTAEGKAERACDRISLGPLRLTAGGPAAELVFRGPAAVVDDGTAYLSVEHALAKSRIETAMEVVGSIAIDSAVHNFDNLVAQLEETIAQAYRADAGPAEAANAVPPVAAFGRLRGTSVVGGRRRPLDAAVRIGISFTGIGPQKFVARRMLWARFDGDSGHRALELRALALEGKAEHRIARMLNAGGWNQCGLEELDLEVTSPLVPPDQISARMVTSARQEASIEGKPETFLTLSRPGPDGTRIHTSLGFASYTMGNAKGAGMFECSRRFGVASAQVRPNETDSD
ncbi:MAG TPA: hypothetical protein VEF07_01340 [Candidatus Binataceae bacterium]|nr:hypothetical protein [Candidatus Binataceae bacterium]